MTIRNVHRISHGDAPYKTVSRVGLDELMQQVWQKLDEMNEIEAEELLAVGVL